MSELNDKIKEIGSLFGITELPDNIGDIVSSFLGGSSEGNDQKGSEDSEKHIESMQKNCDENSNIGNTNLPSIPGDRFEDIDMTKVLSLLQKYREAKRSSNNDKKIRLLYAIEPFLNERRKDKVGSCVKFLTFAQIAKEFRGI